MLKENEKTKAFAELFEDSRGAIGLPSVVSYGKMSKKTGVKQNWVPQEAYKLAQDTLHRNKGVLSEAKISALIAELNKIWKERLRKQVNRVKQNYMAEIVRLRKERAAASHFDEGEAKKAISRLKTDVNCAYKELKDSKAIKEEKESPAKHKSLGGRGKLSDTLNGERRKLRNENAWLKEQIAKLQEVASAEGGERAQYLEGAAWVGNTIAKDADKHVDLISKLCRSYRAKRTNCGDPLEVHVELMKKFDEAIEELKEKMSAMKNSVESKARKIQ
eukprot:TRINITY_DN14062_c0_g1_i3.p1 TRINITY_DN14062_c0_g1~~TRINITY_DN14062_c0_g1_i3.p1  ORF type:complete len:275 (-),score=100.24 TRINITY_DN14062_c0_g1_i3:51-875(-)